MATKCTLAPDPPAALQSCHASSKTKAVSLAPRCLAVKCNCQKLAAAKPRLEAIARRAVNNSNEKQTETHLMLPKPCMVQSMARLQ